MRRQSRSPEPRLIHAALIVLSTSPLAFGVIGAYWNNPAGGTWTDPTNWTAPAVPGAADTAEFKLGSPTPYTVTLPGPATAVNMLDITGDRLTLSQATGSTMTIGSVNIGGISPLPDSITLSGGTFSTGGISSSYTPASVDVTVTAGTTATLGGISLNAPGHVHIDGPGTTVNTGQIGAQTATVSLTNGAQVTTGSGWLTIGSGLLGGGTFAVDSGASLDTGNGYSNLSNASATIGSTAAARSKWATSVTNLTNTHVDINAGGDVVTRGASLDPNSSITVHAGGTYTDAAGITGAGTLRLDGGTATLGSLGLLPRGTLAGSGTIHAATFSTSGWTIAPDGTIAFDPGRTDLRPTPSTHFDFDLTSPTDYDRLTSIRSMQFRGVLNVSADPSYLPAAGDTFQLFSFDSAVPGSTFSSLSLPTLHGFVWDTSALYSTGTIAVVVPEPTTLLAAGAIAPFLIRRRRRATR